MKRSYNVKGEARRELVQVLGRAVGIEPVYMKMPTYAYAIGNIIVNREGAMLWDERTDEVTIQRALGALAGAGFTAEEDEAQSVQEVPTEAAEGPTPPDSEAMELKVSLPATPHTGQTLRNLINLFYTRAELINKSLGTSFRVDEGLVEMLQDLELLKAGDFREAVSTYEDEHGMALSGITITPEEITFSSRLETANPERMKAFTELVSMMTKQALDQHRIQAKTINGENEKYALRIWLTRLGMNGPAYKETRKILMEHLNGHTAFRTEEEKERWIQKRQAEKAAKAEAEERDEISE